MFDANTYRTGDTNLKINACSGGIYKTYKESWFKRFHLTSDLAKTLFRKEECFYNCRTNGYMWRYRSNSRNNIQRRF